MPILLILISFGLLRRRQRHPVWNEQFAALETIESTVDRMTADSIAVTRLMASESRSGKATVYCWSYSTGRSGHTVQENRPEEQIV